MDTASSRSFASIPSMVIIISFLRSSLFAYSLSGIVSGIESASFKTAFEKKLLILNLSIITPRSFSGILASSVLLFFLPFLPSVLDVFLPLLFFGFLLFFSFFGGSISVRYLIFLVSLSKDICPLFDKSFNVLYNFLWLFGEVAPSSWYKS